MCHSIIYVLLSYFSLFVRRVRCVGVDSPSHLLTLFLHPPDSHFHQVVLGAEVVLYRNLSKYNVTTYAQHAAYNLHKTYDSPYPFDPMFNYTW